MPPAKSSLALHNNPAPRTTRVSRPMSVRRLLATLALPIVGLNYFLIAGTHFNLPLMLLLLVSAAVIGFLLAVGTTRGDEEQPDEEQAKDGESVQGKRGD